MILKEFFALKEKYLSSEFPQKLQIEDTGNIYSNIIHNYLLLNNFICFQYI